MAVSVESGSGTDIFLYDVRQGAMSRLTFTAANNFDPVWTPDGKHLIFRGGSLNNWDLWWIRADGGGEPQKLTDLSSENRVGDLGANSLTPDGRHIVYGGGSAEGTDIWTLSLDVSNPDHPKPGTPTPWLKTAARESRPAISPDGRWISYDSNESGTGEVYVQPFSPSPATARGKWQISLGGGNTSMWSRTGPQIFYKTGGRLMVVDYVVQGDTFAARKPRLWSERQLMNVGFTNVDLAPDGKRFAIFPAPETAPGSNVTFLLNFPDEIRRRIAASSPRR